MGWTFSKKWKKKSCLVNELVGGSYGFLRPLAHKMVGNTLWGVFPQRGTGSVIVAYFLQKQGGEWGYKTVFEDMHPYDWSCPLAFLDLAPVACQAWREGVKLYHERVARKLTLGQVVPLLNSKVGAVTLTCLRPLLGKDENGKVWRIPRRMLALDRQLLPN